MTNPKYIHIYIYTYTHICIYIHTYIYIYIYIYTYIHVYVYTYIHIYIFTYIHKYTYTHRHIDTYTHIHIYIYTYIHTLWKYIQKNKSLLSSSHVSCHFLRRLHCRKPIFHGMICVDTPTHHHHCFHIMHTYIYICIYMYVWRFNGSNGDVFS